MREPKLDPSRYAQGLHDYKVGHGLATVFATCAAIEKMHEAIEDARANDETLEASRVAEDAHYALSDTIPSYIVGFAEGALKDFRALVASHEGYEGERQDNGLTA